MENSRMARTPGSRRPVENISNVLDCFTEASIAAKSYHNKSRILNQSRFIAFAPDMVAEAEELASPESLELVVGAQWQVHRVSPMWGVPYLAGGAGQQREEGVGTCTNVGRLVDEEEGGQGAYDEAALARHARALGEVVGRHSEVSLRPLPGLRGNRFDREALSISVKTRMEGRKVDVFQGVLCSVEAQDLKLRTRGATSLPVLLTRGALEVTQTVIAGLERSFDCVVAKLELPQRELQWMAAMWAGLRVEQEGGRRPLAETTNIPVERVGSEGKRGEGGEDKNGVVKLIFGLPDSLGPELKAQVSHFTFEFQAAEIRQIWSCCRDPGTGNEFTEVEMESFHRSIGLHIRRTLGVCVEKLELLQVQLPILRAHRGGRVAFGAAHRVKVALRYLTELCQGDMLEANPSLAVTDDMEADTISMDYTVYREGE